MPRKNMRKSNSAEVNKGIDLYLEQANALKEKLMTAEDDELTSYENAIRYNDQRFITIGLKFYKLSAIALDIILYLHTNGGFIVGNYSDLTAALGRADGPLGHVSNIRKMCLSLEEKGILTIWRKEKSGWPEQIDLNPDWIKLI